MRKKFGSFDVAEDGTLSLLGMRHFPILDNDGNVLYDKSMTYKLVDEETGEIFAKEVNTFPG